MSRSKRDQKGRRINGEIWGHGDYQVVGGKVYPVCGGEPVGSPKSKKGAKADVSRIRRRRFLRELRLEAMCKDIWSE